MKKTIFILLFVVLLCCNVKTEVKYYSNEIIVDHLKESTVAIVNFDEDDGLYKISCSGVWLDKNLFITAYHCINKNINKEDVNLIGEKVWFLTYKDLGDSIEIKGNPRVAEILATNPKNDLALISIPYMGTNIDHQFVKIYQDNVKAGRQVSIVGNAMGLGFSYIHGYVSGNRKMEGPHKREMNVLQISAAVIGGVSGGGVFDFETGELIGICSFTAGVGRNLSFFIRKDSIIEFLNVNNLL